MMPFNALRVLWLWVMVVAAIPGNPLMGQQNCYYSISGTVTESATGEPIAFASVYIAGTTKGSYSDDKGRYRIQGLCPGEYILACSHLGCDHFEKQLILPRDSIFSLELVHTSLLLEGITIVQTALEAAKPQISEALSGTSLDASRGANLGETLSGLTGVSTLKTGTSIAKPVIQGLHSNRVVILNNGVRQEGQQWGSEHAPEIDPYLAGKVEVIKGAGSVRYGAGAIGGVILVEPQALPAEKGISAALNLAGHSNGKMGIAAGMVQGKLGEKFPLSGRAFGSVKRAGNVKTPGYYLNNTGLEETHYSWTLGMHRDRWLTELFYSYLSTELGILQDAHIGNVTDLLEAIRRERPAADGHFTYGINRPKQQLGHELFKVRAQIKTTRLGKFELELARQFNLRQEFDAHRQFGQLTEEPNIEFELTTHSATVNWDQPLFNNWKGQWGIQGMRQKNTTDRGGLIPNFSSLSGGIYGTERWKKEGLPWEGEIGLRFDWVGIEAGLQGNSNVNFNEQYTSFSAAAGLVYKFSDQVKLRAYMGTGWRPPHVSELFSEGVHHGSASYEKGNPNLVSEKNWSKSISATYQKGDHLQFTLSLFHNQFKNFIYLEPQPQPELTIRGAFPAFYYKQADARLMGLEWDLTWPLLKQLEMEVSGSFLSSKNLDAHDYLIYMPANRINGGLKWEIPVKASPLQSPYLRMHVLNVFRQNQAPEGLDFAPPPAGYRLLSLDFNTGIAVGTNIWNIGLSVTNLTNTPYRDYLNRFRYYAHEQGRNVVLRVKIPVG